MVATGDVLETLPDSPLPVGVVERLASHDRIHMATSLHDTDAADDVDEDEGEDEGGGEDEDEDVPTHPADRIPNGVVWRIGLQTPSGGYLVEYLPPDGWVVIRSVTATDRSDDEVEAALRSVAAQTASVVALDELMGEGYDLVDRQAFCEACDRWQTVWDNLKPRFPPTMTAISEAERVFSGTERLSNWSHDFEMQLKNAGNVDPAYFERLLEYCREFREVFPDSDPKQLQDRRSSAGMALFKLGRVEAGELAFETLVEDHPEYAWGYIRWGDAYRSSQFPEVPTDYARAEELYRQPLELDLDQKIAARERLDALNAERQGDSATGDQPD